jgi:hypothetical protein
LQSSFGHSDFSELGKLISEEPSPVHNGALRKVTELSIDTRQAMESILGRSLREDEAISINVYIPAPSGKAREEASRRLLKRID